MANSDLYILLCYFLFHTTTSRFSFSHTLVPLFFPSPCLLSFLPVLLPFLPFYFSFSSIFCCPFSSHLLYSIPPRPPSLPSSSTCSPSRPLPPTFPLSSLRLPSTCFPSLALILPSLSFSSLFSFAIHSFILHPLLPLRPSPSSPSLPPTIFFNYPLLIIHLFFVLRS